MSDQNAPRDGDVRDFYNVDGLDWCVRYACYGMMALYDVIDVPAGFYACAVVVWDATKGLWMPKTVIRLATSPHCTKPRWQSRPFGSSLSEQRALRNYLRQPHNFKAAKAS